jgi:ubiquinone/menaquinone biosynthesis C-methylase UbiE
LYADPRAQFREIFLNEVLSDRRGLTLDLGCNDGRYAKNIEEYVGVDAGLTCLQRFDRQRVWAVAEQLPFKDGCIQTLLLLETLEHIWNRTFVLEECHRVLKRGGELILSAPYGSDP